MNFLTDIGQFHFLRPTLLWLIIPAALACWALARTVFASGGLQKLIDPDLLPHLLLRGGEKRPWLFTLIFTLLTAAIIALAGPTWRKLPTPVYSNQDALVILLDLSPSMMATDLAPNRLTRARLKILDILKQRKDGLTALVAYAGEAHVVTPLTDDTATIANLVPSLSPRIMPVPGSNIEMAVQEGLRLIRDGANGAGRLLAVTDDIAKAAVSSIKSEVNKSDATLSILAVGSGEGSPIPKTTGSGFITDDSGSIIIANFDRRELSRLAQSTGGQFAKITVDDSDIAKVLPTNAMPEQAELTEREFDQWHEEGPWLVLMLLPFALLLFRKGTLACALPLTTALALSTLILSSDNARAAEAADNSSLWQTPNQQGRDLLQEGNAQGAAQLFENSQWRGTAQYRAGEYDAAAENFAQSESPQGLYNLGNSLTQQGRFDEAIKAYDEALKQNPELADAQHNREIAQKLKELQEQQQQQSQQQQSDQQQDQQQDQDSEQNAQQDQQQQDQGDQSQQQNAQQDSQNQQDSQQNAQNQQDQSESQQDQQKQEEQQAQDEQGQKEGEEQEQQANTQPQESDSPLDPETQQALDQWLRQIPDDPAGLMREKFKYESLQRRRAYRAGEWQPPENGATQRW
ncbi:VWA domain-containing protein [Microbulbifer elongatus]|uniref:VWA domain-containing protein n=1 Tax=Microbulbifer elongatus TaxID=86173 RepID=UPI001CFDE9AE|nr:VWA domain-containing protein [Microbulbifer elongatus]